MTLRNTKRNASRVLFPLALAILTAIQLGAVSAAAEPGGVPASASQSGNVDPRLAKSFAFVKTEPEQLPAWIKKAFRESPAPFADRPGYRFGLAQEVKMPGHPPAWVIPGRGHVCAFMRPNVFELGAVSCLPIAAAVLLGMNVVWPEEHASEATATAPPVAWDEYSRDAGRGYPTAMGVVPNRIKAIRFSDEGLRVKVVRNRYVAKAKGRTQTVPPTDTSGLPELDPDGK